MMRAICTDNGGLESEGIIRGNTYYGEAVTLPSGNYFVTDGLYCSMRNFRVLEDIPETPEFTEREKVVEVNETNPKKQFGTASIPLQLWPSLASAYGCLGLYNGGLKYGFNNYKATPVDASIYIAAIKRHLASWEEGEEFDSADGVPHLGAVLANVAILLEARSAGTLVDDRNIGEGYIKERDALKKIVGELQKVHEGKNPKHYLRGTHAKQAT